MSLLSSEAAYNHWERIIDDSKKPMKEPLEESL